MDKEQSSNKGLFVTGVILCILFGFLLLCNLTIIIKGTLYPEQPPSVLGTTPMVVLSGSMSSDAKDHIEVGDLIFVGKVDPNELEVGDVITYMENQTNTVITHRIIKINEQNGKRSFITKGDANNTEDQEPVSEEQIVGIYNFRIPKVGDFALFLQKPLGMMLFIGVPLLAFIIFDIIRRQKESNKDNKKTAEMQAELERLQALVQEQDLKQ